MKMNNTLKLVSISLAILFVSMNHISAQGCLYTNFRYTLGPNGEVKFEDVSSSPVGNVTSWRWTFGDGAISTVKNPTHRYNLQTLTGTQVCFDVSLTVGDGVSNGLETKNICIPLSTQVGSGSLHVTIKNPIPIPDASCPQTWIKAIAGQSLAFEGDVLGGTAPYTYEWDFGVDVTSSRNKMGQGPQYVMFKASSGIACSKFSTVLLTVRDAKGLTGSTQVQVNTRDESQGPGKIVIKPSKASPCVGEDVFFQAIADNAFGFNGYETYEWEFRGPTIASNSTLNSGPVKQGYKKFDVPGQYTINVKTTDGSGSYSGQMIINVKAAGDCNEPDIPVAPFEIWIGDTPLPNGTITLDGNNACGAFDILTGKSKIVVKVPQKGSTYVDACLGLYYFVVEIVTQSGCSIMKKTYCEKSPYDRPLLGGGLLTELFEYIGFAPTQSNGSLLYPLPICLSDCGTPLVGCNQLKIKVGRTRDYIVGNGCPAVFSDGPAPWYINPSLDETYVTPNGTSLSPFFKNEVKTKSCAIKIKDNYPPLSITDINTKIKVPSCVEMTLSMVDNNNISLIKGGLTRNPLETDCSKMCNGSYKSYAWKTYDYYNPNKEINVLKSVNGSTAVVDMRNSYFMDIKNFKEGNQRIFLAEITVADWANNLSSYTKLIAFDAPLSINLPTTTSITPIKRCQGTDILLSSEPIAIGGVPPYTYTWSSANNLFMNGTTASNEENPFLNLTQGGGSITLRLGDNSGCFATQKTVDIVTTNLNAPTLPTAIQYACMKSDNESTLVIGPTNTDLGGSGQYRYRWVSVTGVNNQTIDETGLNYVSDPTAKSPIFRGAQGLWTGSTKYYTLYISDILGGCPEVKSNNVVTVTGRFGSAFVNLGTDWTSCPNTSIILKPVLATSGNFKWESDNIEFPLNITGTNMHNGVLLTPQQVGKPGTKYNYKLTVTEPSSGCSFSDIVNIGTYKEWAYTGYEPVVAPALENQLVPLWNPNVANTIYVNNINNSGATNTFSWQYSIEPNITLSEVQLNSSSKALENAKWSLSSGIKNVTIGLQDGNCVKKFLSNTYYTLRSNPVLTISEAPTKSSCGGEKKSFIFKLIVDVSSGSEFLPKELDVPCVLRHTTRSENSTEWVYTSNYGTPINSIVKLKLSAYDRGEYSAVVPIDIPTVGSSSTFSLEVNNAGLPNSNINQTGVFSGIYRFSVIPNTPIRTEWWVSGARTISYADRQVAFKLVALGNAYSTSKGRGICRYLNVSNDAYVEYAAGRFGSVTITCDVDIQPTTEYFHAYIDPCIRLEATQLTNGGTIESNNLSVNTEGGDKSRQAFSVYPNPFSNAINISYLILDEKDKNVKLSVFDMSGRQIEAIIDNENKQQGEYLIEYSSEKLPPGVYIFELSIEGEKFFKKATKIQ
jgi:hypothetical protein